MSEAKLVVGQEVFYVSNERRDQPRYAKVVKVGRLWAYLDYRDYRINPTTLVIDSEQRSYGTPGRIYLTERQYQDEVALAGALMQLVKALTYTKRPVELKLEAVQQAAALLGVDLT